MATEGGVMRDMAMLPVTGAGSFVGSPTIRSLPRMARSVAGFALVHAAAALVVFLALEGLNEEHYWQCMEACPLLTTLEFYSILFHDIAHVTMKVCSVVQMMAAALALVSTGRPRRAATFVVVGTTVATWTLSIRLVYTALFRSHCCFSGGIVQVASAITVALCQAAIPFWGGWVSYELAHAPLS